MDSPYPNFTTRSYAPRNPVIDNDPKFLSTSPDVLQTKQAHMLRIFIPEGAADESGHPPQKGTAAAVI